MYILIIIYIYNNVYNIISYSLGKIGFGANTREHLKQIKLIFPLIKNIISKILVCRPCLIVKYIGEFVVTPPISI